ncbi:MAG: hydroxyacid dehydrogenase [Porphyromonadaceae bacterium CG2_30_38_12]|nr:MAG: hydroxyacid dehydrogenase [Porphyromonadaceae bacterium CG2_30_38_12]
MEHLSEILLYQTANGETKIDVRLEDETVWLNQKQMADLFQTTVPNINMHLKNIFDEGELDPISTIKNSLIVRLEGNRQVNRNIDFYNLDAIISVGYRIKSHVATHFRIWATKRLREYIVKGFALDDERMKAAGMIRYFDELTERIRDIRSSERIFYQKVKDIFSLSIDYDSKTTQAKEFFATVQNKLHWAIHQHTAAELIASRVNVVSKNMGLTTWAGEKIRKTDIGIAKNYLNEAELSQLNLLVEQFLAFAENQARQKKLMYMNDWIKKLNDILTINENEILEHAGKISHEMALQIAETAYEQYNTERIKAEDLKALRLLDEDLKELGI